MTTQEELLQEHRESYRGFIRVAVVSAIAVFAVLGLLALFTL